jgi:hypothetical protein
VASKPLDREARDPRRGPRMGQGTGESFSRPDANVGGGPNLSVRLTDHQRVPERPMAMTRLGRQRTAGRLSAPEVPALSVERQLSGSKSSSVGL